MRYESSTKKRKRTTEAKSLLLPSFSFFLLQIFGISGGIGVVKSAVCCWFIAPVLLITQLLLKAFFSCFQELRNPNLLMLLPIWVVLSFHLNFLDLYLAIDICEIDSCALGMYWNFLFFFRICYNMKMHFAFGLLLQFVWIY